MKSSSIADLLSPLKRGLLLGAFFGVGAAALIYTRFVESLGAHFILFRKSFISTTYIGLFLSGPLESFPGLLQGVSEPNFFGGMIWSAVESTQGVARSLQQFKSGQFDPMLPGWFWDRFLNRLFGIVR